MNFSEKEIAALTDLLYRMADDQLVIGHRNSEWTGLGPVLEEDIAFSSMAQDKIGHASTLFDLLFQMGEKHPDQNAFTRKEEEMRCCHLVEYPIGEYAFSLIRHFLFDHAELIRYTLLSESTFDPLAQIAQKFRGEIKYHVLHANTWVKQLGSATEESVERMQNALNEAFPLALGMFEESEYENELMESGIFKGENFVRDEWIREIEEALKDTQLRLPSVDSATPSYGGRKGKHTEHLAPLLNEMCEVFSIDTTAEW
jgi:ring-1,2-phenylacetyl-CoA epoxidase subunit PaaC